MAVTFDWALWATRQFGRHRRDLRASQLDLEPGHNGAIVKRNPDVMSDVHMEVDDVDQGQEIGRAHV